MLKYEKGDTLIEVLFAITVFALVMVGSLSIMNQGTIAAQRSVEITQVRQQIDAQAEAIRFIHSAYVAAYTPGATLPGGSTPAGQWSALVSKASTTNASAFGNNASAVSCSPLPNVGRSFFINTQNVSFVQADNTSYKSPATFAQVNGAVSEGIWVEAVNSPASGSTNGFIDFHIRACWPDPGMGRLMNIGTIVRLYVPQ